MVIDPKRIPLADRAEMYLRIRPGTDGAMALAMINVIVDERLYDEEFIAAYTTGFDKLATHIEKFTPEWAEKITWVSAEAIRKLARLFATRKGRLSTRAPARRTRQPTGRRTAAPSRSFRSLRATLIIRAAG